MSSAGPSLHTRGPAYSVVGECLRIHSSARRRSVLGRLFGQSPLTADARGWYRGALAELHVATLLTALGYGYTVLHSVDATSGSDNSIIDHLIIGPTGVFAVSSKNHSGQRVSFDCGILTVNGHRTHHLADSRLAASRAARLLNTGVDDPIDVTPVVAIVDPGSLARSHSSLDVLVLGSNRLAHVIAGRPPVLTIDQVADIVDRASRPGTWNFGPHQLDATADRQARFGRLRSEVEAAAHRRLAWMFGAVVVLAVPIFSSGLLP